MCHCLSTAGELAETKVSNDVQLISFPYACSEVWRPNGKAHLPAPGLHNRHSEQAHQHMRKSRDTRSAEGAGQVQRGLGAGLLLPRTTAWLQQSFDIPRQPA
jgi:hypothetical protein